MARASREMGKQEVCVTCALGIGLLIADGRKTIAGDPVVFGFTFELKS